MNSSSKVWLIFLVMCVFGIAAFVFALIINQGATS